MKTRELKQKLREWRKDPLRFIHETVYVRGADGKSRPIRLWPLQEEAIKKLGAPDKYGRYPYHTIWFCWPRRIGKSTLTRLLSLWSFIVWPGREVWFVSNSREQVFNVLFSDLRRDILNSPILLRLVGGKDNVGKKEIISSLMGSRCALLPYDDSKCVGLKVDCAVMSEVWAMGGTEVYDALLVGTATTNGMVLLDSTAPPAGSPWERFLRDPPPGMYVDWRVGLDTYKQTPITDTVLEAFRRSMTPIEYRSKILNEIVEASLHRMFTREQIEHCMRDYSIPISKDALERLFESEIGTRAYRIYIGLDRSLGGEASDLTVLTALAYGRMRDKRLAVIADQRVLDGSKGTEIVENILEILKLYGQGRVYLEAYSTIDIQEYLQSQGIYVELVHPSQKAQMEAFPKLYSAITSGQFVFSSFLTGLAEELEHFGYDPIKHKYGGLLKRKTGGIGDDRIYSLIWPLAAAWSGGGGSGKIEAEIIPSMSSFLGPLRPVVMEGDW